MVHEKIAGATNPISGERYAVGEDSNDGVLRWETYIAKRGAGPPGHPHPRQEERFVVRSGSMGTSVGGREAVLREDEEPTVAPGYPTGLGTWGRTSCTRP